MRVNDIVITNNDINKMEMHFMKPKVSVLMPVYNNEKYVEEAINSILYQTFKDFEFLIINDCSTDNSLNLIKKFSDPRIKIINNENNLEISNSLNIGIKAALGEYIVRMDADDISCPERIEKQVKFMDGNPEIGLCGSAIETFQANNYVWSYPQETENIKIMMLFQSCFAHPSVIYRKSLFEKYNLSYNPDYPSAQDYELWVKAIECFQMTNLKEVLLKYRCHTDQKTNKPAIKKLNLTQQIIKNQLLKLGIIPSEEEIAIHLSLIYSEFDKDFKKNYEYILQVENWFLKIIKANELKKIYDKKLLKRLLAYKWYASCKRVLVEYPSLEILKYFYKSPFSKSVKLGKRIGFIFKYLRGKS